MAAPVVGDAGKAGMLLMGAFSLSAAAAALLLPETLGKPLPSTVEEMALMPCRCYAAVDDSDPSTRGGECTVGKDSVAPEDIALDDD